LKEENEGKEKSRQQLEILRYSKEENNGREVQTSGW
jgi:hypothetical protein